jgi:hypothetical protein
MRSVPHQEEGMKASQHQEGSQKPIQNRNGVLRASQHQRGTTIAIDNNANNSLQRRTHLQESRGVNNKNNSECFCCLCLFLVSIMVQSYVYHAHDSDPFYRDVVLPFVSAHKRTSRTHHYLRHSA